jgi:hypothetical protein
MRTVKVFSSQGADRLELEFGYDPELVGVIRGLRERRWDARRRRWIVARNELDQLRTELDRLDVVFDLDAVRGPVPRSRQSEPVSSPDPAHHCHDDAGNGGRSP